MALREVFARFFVNFDVKQLEKGDKAVQKTTKAIGKLGLLLGGTAIVHGLRTFIDQTLAAGVHLDTLSQKTGFSTKAIQEWSHIVEQAGLNVSLLDQAFTDFQEKAGDAIQGSETMRANFAKLGITLDDIRKQSVEELFTNTAVALGELEDANLRVYIANQLMSTSGRELIPVFKGGRAEIERLRKELEESGGIIDQDTIKQIKEADRRLKMFRRQTEAFKAKALLTMLPYLEKWWKNLTKLAGRISKVVEKSEILKATMIVLGGIVAAIGLKMLLPWLPLIAVLGTLILIVDDLIVGFRGGESVIGDLLGLDLKAWAEGAVMMMADLKNSTAAAVEVFKILGNVVQTAFGWLVNGVGAAVKWTGKLLDKLTGVRGGGAEFGAKLEKSGLDIMQAGARGAVKARRQLAFEKLTAGNRRERAMEAFRSGGASAYVRSLDGSLAGSPGSMAGSSKTLNQSNSINVTVQGNADESTANQIVKKIREESERQLRATQAAFAGGSQ